MKALSTILSAFLLIILSSLTMGQNQTSNKNLSAENIIEKIINKTGSRAIPNTVDVIKEGNSETSVTGIATSMFATMEVLKKAVDKNCNLLIVHEPLYYNHLDETEQFKNDPVFLEKQHYINDHKLVIWRFHDYIHSMKPDGIGMGMIEKLGWKDFSVKGRPGKFSVPETTLNELLKTLKKKFPEYTFNVIGNPEMKLTNISFAPGASGSMYHIRLLEENNTDVVIAGESQQWETYEYARDAVAQGRNKAVVFLGHIASEEAGMAYCAEWLKSFIKDVPVFFIESGPSYWSY